MQLRHIRPRSVDWYDATLQDEDRGFYRLSPEEKSKLRHMGQPEPQLATAAMVNRTTLESHGPTRQLL
jgi:hypothetical protein